MSLWYAICDALPLEMLHWDFMKNALLALLLMAPLFGVLSTMIVTGHMSFFSDALGHSAFTGIALGSLFGIAAPTWAAVAFSVFFALLFSYLRRDSNQAADTLIGVFSSAAVALGILVATMGGGSFTKYNKYLVGDVLSITPGEIGMLAIVLLAVLVFWCLYANPADPDGSAPPAGLLPGHSRGAVPNTVYRNHCGCGDPVHFQHGPADPQFPAGAAGGGLPEYLPEPEAVPSVFRALCPGVRHCGPEYLLQLRLLCRRGHQPGAHRFLCPYLCFSWEKRLMETMEMHPIAHMRSDFPTKFGIPRQSGLVEELRSMIVFEPEYRSEDALRGIEDFSHLWLIWQFSQAVREGWSPTVRPPRLGGNTRMGVFATRPPSGPTTWGSPASVCWR